MLFFFLSSLCLQKRIESQFLCWTTSLNLWLFFAFSPYHKYFFVLFMNIKPKEALIKRALFSTDAASLGKNCKPQVTYKSRLSTSMHAWFAMEPVFTLFVGTIMMRIQDKTNLLSRRFFFALHFGGKLDFNSRPRFWLDGEQKLCFDYNRSIKYSNF